MNMWRKTIIRCDCGCVLIEIDKDFEDNLYYFSTYESSYMTHSGRVKGYFKRLWNALRGKDYFLYELILTPEEVRKIVDLYHSKETGTLEEEE